MTYNILMIGKPGGNLVRTYEWHIEALNGDKSGRFRVDDLHAMQQDQVDVRNYDIFWFYAKAFHPSMYHQIRQIRPDAKVICGPNVMLDKPDVGLAMIGTSGTLIIASQTCILIKCTFTLNM